MLAGSIPTRVGRPKKDLIEGERPDPRDAGRVEHFHDVFGLLSLRFDPMPQGRMIGHLVRGQELAQEFLDLPQAQAHRQGGGGELPLFGLVAPDQVCGVTLAWGDHLLKSWVLGAEFGPRRVRAGLGSQSLLDFAGVFVDRLTAPLRVLRLPCDGAMLTREDRGGVEDPGANR
jgi:hypothetical protein